MSNSDTQCFYCGWTGGHHARDCPKDDKEAKVVYEKGWSDGRAGRERSSQDAAYDLGYTRGEVALETAENTRRSDYYG